MGKCKSLGSLKSLLWYAPCVSGVSILLFSILNPLRVHSWGWLLAWRQQCPLLMWQVTSFFHSGPAERGRTLEPQRQAAWVGLTLLLCGSCLTWDDPPNGEGSGPPLPYSCLENPMDGGAWWAVVHGVVKSRTRLSDFTFTFHFHALEKEMAAHSSVLAWRIPGVAEPSMGSYGVGLKQLSSSSRPTWVLSSWCSRL